MRNLAARLRNSRVVKIAFSRPLLHSTVRVSDVELEQVSPPQLERVDEMAVRDHLRNPQRI